MLKVTPRTAFFVQIQDLVECVRLFNPHYDVDIQCGVFGVTVDKHSDLNEECWLRFLSNEDISMSIHSILVALCAHGLIQPGVYVVESIG